jgi:glycosyltransferase involved in cell wall biosynthesis
MPKLSIITINFNNIKGLQKTLDSVFGQGFKDFEYIIIDGDSTDGSKELIASNAIKFSSWVSEKDTGIYNAMNKGIKKATGKYILFLNSGDFLIHENCLADFNFEKANEDILCANIKINDKGQYSIKMVPDKLSFDYFTKDTLPHQSTFIKRTLFEQVGLYNENLKFVADWKFYLDALCKFNATYLHINEVFCEYNLDGFSSEPENAAALHKERADILAAEYALFYDDYKKYDQCKAALRAYNNSRLHSFVSRILRSGFYKTFIRK